ncbi:O-linked-mannose beta-1-2-N-acetylglucosaminyltransferase 1-like 9 [Homarus americanus]|uniref:Alpha-1,3-mannosyl-glycoprotein 2-beta-N-acetylglucosaminyltransferase n=1 Tax=Homarus americanus TaxID=6706 RepID=A0A8J5NEM4_HOMAM|nr:O-linked-mannose beta-1-2-N-acetylglucosaminyltransferase 1-like 9 [Homarus americanus]
MTLLSAHRLPHVLRQVGQAWASPGGTNTPITIYVDGHNPEARALGALLNVPVVEHDNPVPLGSSARVNEHIKFAVREVFEGHPTANLAIILEDDLDLAPDFIPYFHQTAPLLTSDPYLMFVNAFNYNSYAHTAYDPRRLYRAHGIPGYGWMTTRQGAAEMLANWVPVNQTNAVWDWWVRAKVMRDKDMLMPEVPRTRHMGGGGTHISGFDQVLFSSQPLNNLSLVQLDVGSAKEGNYEFHIRKEMSSAQVVTLTHHPSGHTTTHAQVSRHQRPGHTREPTDDDTFPFYGNQVYLVACPHSPYCRPNNKRMVYKATQDDADFARESTSFKPPLRINYALRVPSRDPQQEFNLLNRQVVDYTTGG